MANKSVFLTEAGLVNHTPSGAVSAGEIIQLGGKLSAIAKNDIAASALGVVATGGVFEAPYVGGIANVGDNIWWDANGTPYGGAADGAFTAGGAAGDWWAGTLVEATTATSATCKVALNVANPDQPAWIGRAHFTTAVDLTMVEATHSGGVVHVTADAKTITLPTGVVGMEYIVVNDNASAAGLVTVDLDGNEIIRGANLTIAATKTALNTKTTAVRGDYLHLVCTVAATAWRCEAKRGTWVTS